MYNLRINSNLMHVPKTLSYPTTTSYTLMLTYMLCHCISFPTIFGTKFCNILSHSWTIFSDIISVKGNNHNSMVSFYTNITGTKCQCHGPFRNRISHSFYKIIHQKWFSVLEPKTWNC